MGIAFEGTKKRRHMGQRYAKHQMQSGVRVYHQRHYQQAIARWRTALSRLRNAEDRFITLGYMAQAFCDCSDYESMLHYALQQMELANARHDDFMKSEALLNLSKAYERLADYGKAVNYGRASLQHPNIDARSPGYAHLGIALAHLGLSQFHTALEDFERAMAIAGDTGDKLLELQICVGLGTLFTLLRDLSKALIFLRNALSILQLVTADNVHAKYKSIILYQLSVVLRLKGSLVDARQVCDETLRLAYQTSNRATYARALASMADINRELGESEAKETITKSWARYEQAFRIMRQIKDRMGETIVLGSMAKSASESRSHYTGQCECQAIQLNRKCLELSKMIGCKHAMLKCHLRLQELYGQLEDEDSEEAAAQVCVSLIQEMELFCNFCGQRYGDRDDSLQALRCSHIFHEKCLHKFLAEGEDLICPKCKRGAIVMEDLTAHTSAATRTSEVADSVALPSIRYPDQPSTSFASQTGRNLLKLTPLNIPQYAEEQHRPLTKDIVRQQLLQDQPFSLKQQQQRETTAPPTIPTFAEARATVRIPRTTSVPLADSGEIVYASSNYLREYGTTGDVFSLANRMIEDASESLRSPPTVSSSTTVGAGSTMRTIKSARIRPKSSLCAGASTSRVNELRRLATAMEVGAESSQQEFSLSASTSSIAFYPSAMNSTETRLRPKTTVESSRPAAKIDDSGATSAASFSASTSASGGSTEKNSPPASHRDPLPSAGNRLLSRAERMRALSSVRHFISEDTDAESFKRMSSADSEKSTTASKMDKGPLELTIFKNSPRLGQFGRAETIDYHMESDLDSTGPAKKKKPPPPPRKPCCAAGAGGTFPSFSNELLDAPPPTLAFPTMLERAMRTVFEEDIEEPMHRSSGANDSTVVEYLPPPLLSNNVVCSTLKKSAKGSLSQEQDSEASEDTGASGSQAEITPTGLQNHDNKPNCSDQSTSRTTKANAFVVRHGAGVTDL